jgi:hypothetical protein
MEFVHQRPFPLYKLGTCETILGSLTSRFSARRRLEAISQIPQQNYTAGEVKHPKKGLRISFIPDHEPAEVLQPGKQPLNLPTPTIASEASQILGFVFAVDALPCN